MQGTPRTPWISSGVTAIAVSLVLAACTIWVLLTDPLTVAMAIRSGDVPAIASLVVDALVSAIEVMLTWI